MPCSRAQLPKRFAEWVDRKLPQVGGGRRVRLRYCDRLPFEWLFAAALRPSGLTLWRSIYLRPRLRPFDPCDRRKVELILHELIHVGQFRARPLTFPIAYLLNFAARGYRNHPAEVEARAEAHRLAHEYARDDPCGCGGRGK